MSRKALSIVILAVLALHLAAGDCAAAGTAGPPPATHAYVTLAILASSAVLFFTEALPLPITAMLAPVALSVFDIIPAKSAFANFGNQWVIIFMAMFIVGESTFVTGFADKVGRATLKLSKGSETRLLLLTMLAVGGLSAFLSNTGTIVVAIPMVMAMCSTAGIPPGRILMPVAFASSLGGSMTLVGTPPNGIINSVIEKMAPGTPTFGFFEFGKFGLLLFGVSILYYALVGRKLLPKSAGACAQDQEASKPRRPGKMYWSLGIFVFVVAVMASEAMDLAAAAMLGACLVVATGCMTMEEAFKSIDWTTIFLFAGMLSLSTALEQSGAAELIAKNVVALVQDPYLVLAVCCGLTALVTNFMSNTATAALMAPLAVPIAAQSGVSPLPLMMGIAMSASACFLTPVATPPNTIVLGPGRYTFMDYLKAGWPLQLISYAACVLVIPMIWPF